MLIWGFWLEFLWHCSYQQVCLQDKHRSRREFILWSQLKRHYIYFVRHSAELNPDPGKKIKCLAGICMNTGYLRRLCFILLKQMICALPWAAELLRTPSQRSYLNGGTGGDHTCVIDGVAVVDIIWQRRALLHLWRGCDRRQWGVLGRRADVCAIAKSLNCISWPGERRKKRQHSCWEDTQWLAMYGTELTQKGNRCCHFHQQAVIHQLLFSKDFKMSHRLPWCTYTHHSHNAEAGMLKILAILAHAGFSSKQGASFFDRLFTDLFMALCRFASMYCLFPNSTVQGNWLFA